MRVSSATGAMGRMSSPALRVRGSSNRTFGAQQHAGTPAVTVLFVRQTGQGERRGMAYRVQVHKTRSFGPPLPQGKQNFVCAFYGRSSRTLRLALYTRGLRARVFRPGRFSVASAAQGMVATATMTVTAINTQPVAPMMTATATLTVLAYGGYPEPVTSLDYIAADSSLAATGHTIADQAECQLGNGTNVPPGTSDFGFVDTTYDLTTAQILAGVATQAY